MREVQGPVLVGGSGAASRAQARLLRARHCASGPAARPESAQDLGRGAAALGRDARLRRQAGSLCRGASAGANAPGECVGRATAELLREREQVALLGSRRRGTLLGPFTRNHRSRKNRTEARFRTWMGGPPTFATAPRPMRR